MSKKKESTQDPKLSDILAEAIKHLQITNVFLKSSNLDCISGPGAIEQGTTEISTDTKHEWSLSADKKFLVAFVTMKLEGKKQNEVQFFMEASFALVYEVSDNHDFTEDSLSLFVKSNALYNSYPYFREFFQNTMIRMGLPPFHLPLLKPLTKDQMNSTKTKEVTAP